MAEQGGFGWLYMLQMHLSTCDLWIPIWTSPTGPVVVVEYLHLNKVGIWLFDCSSAHEGLAADTLNVNNMNSNLPSNSQIHRLICSSAHWFFFSQNFKFWSDTVNQSKPQVWLTDAWFSCLCWAWHWFSTHLKIFGKNFREWLYLLHCLNLLWSQFLMRGGWQTVYLAYLACGWKTWHFEGMRNTLGFKFNFC